mmetsp:Transcript_21404/g.61959  ORF Transcript_21404/g.61959 Transcript_21404/m.61959 type:complete len:238 (+) Transcript_21404:78-791(+)
MKGGFLVETHAPERGGQLLLPGPLLGVLLVGSVRGLWLHGGPPDLRPARGFSRPREARGRVGQPEVPGAHRGLGLEQALQRGPERGVDGAAQRHTPDGPPAALLLHLDPLLQVWHRWCWCFRVLVLPISRLRLAPLHFHREILCPSSHQFVGCCGGALEPHDGPEALALRRRLKELRQRAHCGHSLRRGRGLEHRVVFTPTSNPVDALYLGDVQVESDHLALLKASELDPLLPVQPL